MLLSNMALGLSAGGVVLNTSHSFGLSSVMTMLQQQTEPVAVSHLNETLLMWFVGIAALALLAQAVILAAVAIGGAKIAKDVMKIVEEGRAKAMPLIDTTHTLVKDLTPQIKQITNKVEVIVGHVEDISGVAAEKVHEFSPTVSAARETVEQANETVRDANRKTHEQIVRVNGMISAALDSTSRAGAAVQRGVAIPGRELSGLVHGLRVGFDHWLGRVKHMGEDRPLGGMRQPVRTNGSTYRPQTATGSGYTPASDETLGIPVVPPARDVSH